MVAEKTIHKKYQDIQDMNTPEKNQLLQTAKAKPMMNLDLPQLPPNKPMCLCGEIHDDLQFHNDMKSNYGNATKNHFS